MYITRRLERDLETFRTQLPRTIVSPRFFSPGEIMADLAALESEFDSVEIDLEEQLIGVTTGPIELEAVYLGPFRIVLHWQRIGRGRAYEIEAIEPNAAEGRRQMQCAKLIRQSH